jgi:phage I-like protein
MIFYLLLQFSVKNNDMAEGVLKLVTHDDLRVEKLSVCFNAEVNAALDTLVVNIEPNVTIPTSVASLNTGKDYEYNLEKSVTDTTELASLMALFGALTE